MNNSLSIGPKTLNLNKRAYIEYLKGKRPAWLFNNQNFIKEATLYPELMKSVDLFRYKRYIENKKNMEKDEMPGPMVDGIENQKYYHAYFKKMHPHHEIKEFGFEEGFLEESLKKVHDYVVNKDNFVLFEPSFIWIFEGQKINVRADILVKTNGKISYYEAKAINDIPCLIHGIDLGFQYNVLKRMNYNVDEWNWHLLTLNKTFVLKNDIFDEIQDLYQVNDRFSNKKLNLSKVDEEIDIDLDKEIKVADRTMLIKDYLNGADFETKTKVIKNHFIDFEDNLRKIIEIQKLDEIPDERLQITYKSLEDTDYIDYFLFKEGIAKGDNSVFDFIGDSGFSYGKKLELHYDGFNLENIFNAVISPVAVSKKILKGTSEWYEMIQEHETKLMTGKKAAPLVYDGEQNIIVKVKLDTLLDIKKFNDDKEYAKSKMFEFGLKRVIQKYSTIDNEIKSLPTKIKEEYKKYKTPIYMYDFETVNNAQPQILLSSPYEQVPFQFSIHVITDIHNFDFKTKKNVIHKEFLVKNKEDFRKSFWKEFIKAMTENGKGTYVSYNKSFEKTVIRKEIEKQDLTTLTDKDFDALREIHLETIDLQDFFKKFYYVAPTFMGSTSIKKVGPHFAPELDYSKLKIGKGDKASHECKIWLLDNKYDDQWKNNRKYLLEYCDYDTLSMVAILQGLKKYEN